MGKSFCRKKPARIPQIPPNFFARIYVFLVRDPIRDFDIHKVTWGRSKSLWGDPKSRWAAQSDFGASQSDFGVLQSNFGASQSDFVVSQSHFGAILLVIRFNHKVTLGRP